MITKSVRLPAALWAALEAAAHRDKRSGGAQVHFIIEGWARGAGLYPLREGDEPRVVHEVRENVVAEQLPLFPERGEGVDEQV